MSKCCMHLQVQRIAPFVSRIPIPGMVCLPVRERSISYSHGSMFTVLSPLTLAVGLAHNRVMYWQLSPTSSAHTVSALMPRPLSFTAHLTGSTQCDDRSLIYSLSFHGSCPHRLLVAAGTAFSGVMPTTWLLRGS